MRIKLSLFITVLAVGLGLAIQSAALGDYAMPGADVERSSWIADTTNPAGMTPQWHKEFAPGEGFIPSISHIITVTHTGTPDLHYLYVSTSRGVYCLDADNGGAVVWFYQTLQPVGNSVTVIGGVAYIPCFDKRIHAVDAITGTVVWKSQKMGAGFRANPLVVNGKVYAGCRDGKFYCLDAANGTVLWSYDTGSGINHSACYKDGVVYFGDLRMYAYALNAETGAVVWVSEQFEGDGFYDYWPVIYQDRVIFGGSICYLPYGSPKMVTEDRNNAWPSGLEKDDPPGPVDANGWIDATSFLNYITAHPDRRSFFVLNQSNGARNPAYTPILWVGNASGCRYPALVRPGGNPYVHNMFKYSATESAAQGWLVEWQLGTPYIRNVDFGTAPQYARSDVVDEPDGWLGTTNYIYYQHHSARGAGWMKVDGSGNGTIYSSNITLESHFPGYNSNWFNNRRYGDPSDAQGMQAGTHGYQNPPVPFNDALYMHCSNAVLCYGH